MQEKEVDNPLLISNFEINKRNNAVVLYISSKIFPAAIVNKTALLFKDKSWIAVDANEEEILVELKPKISIDLEILAREFNNELLSQTTQEIKVDAKSNALLSRIKEVVAEFAREEEGHISKRSMLIIGAVLATLGLAEVASGTHLCTSDGDGGGYTPPPTDGGGDGGGGGGGGGGCEGGGGCA